MADMIRGQFIAFEGGEGRGKSTQAALLAEALAARGVAVVSTREPGGTPGAEAIRELLLTPPGEGWGPVAEALLFAAARADHVARVIAPALERGDWVICDRFLDSSRAYQGAARGVGDDTVRTLHRIGSHDLLPDLTIMLQAAEETASLRLQQRDGEGGDVIGGRSPAYHDEVGAAFMRFASTEPARFAVICGEGSIAAVHQRVMSAILPLLEHERA